MFAGWFIPTPSLFGASLDRESDDKKRIDLQSPIDFVDTNEIITKRPEPMNISHLKAFLEIAEIGSFQHSAERLHITQSTISARIKTLEEQLGQDLFIRRRDGAQLTPQGHKLVPHAQAAVQAWEQAKLRLSLPEQLSHMLAIGVQMDLWADLLLPWVDQIKTQRAEVGFALRVEFSEVLLKQIHEGGLDMALCYSPSRMPGFVSQRILLDELILASSEQRAAQTEWREDYVHVDWGESFRQQYQQAYTTLRAPALTVGTYTLALDYIERNGGCAFMPKRAVQNLLDSGKLHQIQDAPVFEHPVYLVRPSAPNDPELVDFAQACLGQMLGTT